MSARPFHYCPICATPLQKKIVLNEERLACPACGWVYYEDPKVAAGVLVIESGKVLLVKRVMQPFTGLWSMPAGFVNAYEDPARAAERECREETGLTAQVDHLYSMDTGREHPRGADILLIYSASICDGELQAADDAADVGWFSLDALPPLAFTSTRRLFAQIHL
jgi:ADP-ribose pyrophosphatase YjhB (NUDIX family)